MTFEQFQKLVDGGLNLHPAIGIKVKKDGKDLCFFRHHWSEDPLIKIQCVKDVVTGVIYFENKSLLKKLEREMQFGDLVFSMCCCHKCNSEESKAVAQKFFKDTGERISHGILAEHYEGEVEFMKQEMERR